MIESAAQVLLAASSNAKNSVDNAAMFRNNNPTSGTAFGDVFSQSKSQSERRADDVTSKRSQSRQAESSSVEQRRRSQTENTERSNSERSNTEPSSSELSNTESSKKVNSDNAESRISQNTNNTQEKNERKDGEKTAIEGESVDELAAKEITTKQEIENAVSEIIEESLPKDVSATKAELALLSAEADLKQNIEKITADITDDTLKADVAELAVDAALKVDAESADDNKPTQKLAQIAQAIINELDASKQKAGELESDGALTRTKILSDIEKALEAAVGEKEDLPQDKLVKPDLAVNANAAKVLAEQIKSKDLNIATGVGAELLAESEGEALASSLESSTDALLEKMLQRLDFSKLKGEENQFAKVVADRSAIAEISEQAISKASGDASSGSLLSAANSLTGKAGVAPAPQQLSLNTNINQPQWGTDFSKRIQFMINNDIKNAELRLDPPELGRINIKISMNQDQASVVFTSAQGSVRETIENTLPRLREMLQESGIQLSDANVNEGKKGNENQSGAEANSRGAASDGFDDEVELEDNPQPLVQHSVDGVIDYFA